MGSDCVHSIAAAAPWHRRFSASYAVLSGPAAAPCRTGRAAGPCCALSEKRCPASSGKHMLSVALRPSKSPLDWKNEGADKPPLLHDEFAKQEVLLFQCSPIRRRDKISPVLMGIRLASKVVTVRCLLNVKIIPSVDIHLVRPLDHVGKQVAFRFRLTLQDSVHNRHCLRTDKLGQCQRNGIIEHFHSVRIPRSTAAGLKHLRYLRCLPVQAQARHLNRYASDPHCRLAAAQVLILSDIQSSED